MCTLILLHQCFDDAPLVVAANRDEYLDRPAELPALRQWHGRAVVAPLDQQAGGTWLGLNCAGLFAGLTNRPNPSPDRSRRSRGLLVSDALALGRAVDAARALEQIPAGTYNPFNLLVADGARAFVAVGEEKVRVTELAPGAHVIGNADPNDQSVAKVARSLDEACAATNGSSDEALERLAETCRSHDEPDGPLSRTCIHAGGYGTRSSTLLRRGRTRDADLLRYADGPPCETPYMEMTPLLRALDRFAGRQLGAPTRNVA